MRVLSKGSLGRTDRKLGSQPSRWDAAQLSEWTQTTVWIGAWWCAGGVGDLRRRSARKRTRARYRGPRSNGGSHRNRLAAGFPAVIALGAAWLFVGSGEAFAEAPAATPPLLAVNSSIALWQGPPGHGPAKAQGDGDVIVLANTVRPPIGGRIHGITVAGAQQPAMDIYSELGVTGGLARVHVRMDILQNRAGEAARQISMAKDAGMQVLMTAVGTPLSNASNTEGEDLGIGMPPHARSVPADIQTWADDLVGLLQTLDTDGALPEYVEIWNEPDRTEWWEGTAAEYLSVLQTAANTIETNFPDQIKIGGSGLAGARSQLDGVESLLLQIIENAVATGHDLDFLSWHHYTLASGLRYWDTANILRTRLASHGLNDVELIVSEWNVYPSPIDNPDAIDFDGAHAAAQYAGFLADLSALDIDGHTFFMLMDMRGNATSDLTGAGMGALTRHGIKKPVYRVMEVLAGMAQENRVQVNLPTSEYAVSVFGTRLGQRLRLVIANDVMDPIWLWARGCNERGIQPGTVGDVFTSIPYTRTQLPTIAELEQAGLTNYEATMGLEVLPLTFVAQDLLDSPRPVNIRIPDVSRLRVTSVWRFDPSRNNVAAHRSELLPMLQDLEVQADDDGWDALVATLLSDGEPTPQRISMSGIQNELELAATLGIPNNTAFDAWRAYWDTFHATRLGSFRNINDFDFTRMRRDHPLEAGVRVQGNNISLTMKPNSVLVLNLRL